MGISLIKESFKRLFDKKKKLNIVMVGLDGAGKTTILYKLKLNDFIVTIPTIGFNVETINHKNISFIIWDIGGQDKIRDLWDYYYKNTNAVIFVLDSEDRDRIEDSCKELWKIINNYEMTRKPILVLANKQDVAFPMRTGELIERLNLVACKDHPWYIQETSAINGEGIYEGIDWLSKQC